MDGGRGGRVVCDACHTEPPRVLVASREHIKLNLPGTYRSCVLALTTFENRCCFKNNADTRCLNRFDCLSQTTSGCTASSETEVGRSLGVMFKFVLRATLLHREGCVRAVWIVLLWYVAVLDESPLHQKELRRSS